ncbi:hypothetical protein ACVIJ6_004812 [Bradyrhizobium sp. USDA 4369]
MPTNDPMRTAKSCGPGIPVLMPSSRCQVRRARGGRGQDSRSPGRVRISRQTIARGRPDDPACTCGDCRLLFLLQAGHGCDGHPAFPAPSLWRGRSDEQHSDARCGREEESVCLGAAHVSPSLRGATRRSNPESSRDSGLLPPSPFGLSRTSRFARDDAFISAVVPGKLRQRGSIGAAPTRDPYAAAAVRGTLEASTLRDNIRRWLWIPAFARMTLFFDVCRGPHADL